MIFTQLTPYTTTSIVTTADTSLTLHYKPFSKHKGGRVYSVFFTAITDFDFLKIVIYNNDYLQIPPVETFLVYYTNSLPRLNDESKQYLGALFGNLFRFVFNYTTVKRKQYGNFIVGSAKYYIA